MGGKMINCQEAEEMSNRYISKTLTLEELRLFMKHIENCPRCREDMETYFIVDAALKQLDKDEDIFADIKHLMELDINKRKRWVYRGILLERVRIVVGFLFSIVLLAMIGFGVYTLLSLLLTLVAV